MPKRDPQKTARNKQAAQLDAKLATLAPRVLELTKSASIQVLNAKVGGKYQELANVKERCIRSAEELASLYLDSLRKRVLSLDPASRRDSAYYALAQWYKTNSDMRQYVEWFIERTFLRHFEELSRVKPTDQDARLWIGENNAHYGLFVTPRFNKATAQWENDKSEIRRFKAEYYTIEHVLSTGLVVPGKDSRITFHNVSEYLTFFVDTLVRGTASIHQTRVAERYSTFVLHSESPLAVPLLIPELRYLGQEKKHKHRLDFCVIDPFSLRRIGFELSPWSSHGQLSGTKKMSVAEVNAKAQANRDKELRKISDYFLDKDIQVVVFTDADLADPDAVFQRISSFLAPTKRPQQLLLHSAYEFLHTDFDAEVVETDD